MEINGYPNYLIYDDGRVYNKKFKRFLKPCINNWGYEKVILSKNGVTKTLKIHRLVALHFIDNPENKPEVDHINDIRHDNRIQNLQWLTKKENMDKKKTKTNTGEKYITKTTVKNLNYYFITKKKCFNQNLRCDKYTLDDAINLRDSLLSI